MKAFLLFTSMLIVITGSAIAQEQNPAPIRETLFGKDYKTQMQQEQTSNKSIAADPRKTATSTKSLVFSDYRQPSARKTMNTAAAKKASGAPLPSDISAKDAAAKAPKPANITPPVIEQDAATAKPTTKKN